MSVVNHFKDIVVHSVLKKFKKALSNTMTGTTLWPYFMGQSNEEDFLEIPTVQGENTRSTCNFAT